MKFGVPWSVKGIRPEARETAKEAARRSGMSLGDWLNSVILQQAAQGGPQGQMFADEGEDSYGDELVGVHQRLDDLTQRIEQFTRKGPEAYAPRHHRTEPDQIAALIGRLDRRLDQFASMVPPVVTAPPLAPAPPPFATAPRGSQPAFANVQLPPSLDRAVAEIAARQRALNGVPAAVQRQAYAAPAPTLAPLPAQDISGLEEQLRKITDQIETLRKPGVEEAINALRGELGDIGRALSDAMPKRAIDTLEKQIEILSQRVADGRQAGVDAGALSGIEQGLGEVRDALHGLTPAENLVGFNDAVIGLAQKIDLIVAQKDPATLQQLESAITTLRSMAGNVASNEAVARLAGEVQSLADKVEHIGSGAARDVLDHLESRIEALSNALAERAQGGNTVPPRLEALVQSLSDKIEQVQEIQQSQQSQGDNIAVNHLEDRIVKLVEKLDASEGRLGQLEAIERGLADLLVHIEDIRTAKPAAAGQVEPSPAVDGLKSDIARTHDALDAVHGTLGMLVDRMATLEKNMHSDRRAAPVPRAHEHAEDVELRQPVGKLAVRLVNDPPPAAAPPPQPAPVKLPLAAPFTVEPPPAAVALAPPPQPQPAPAPQPTQQQPHQQPQPPKRMAAADRLPIDPDLPPDQPLEPGSGRPHAQDNHSARIAASEAALGNARPAAGTAGSSSFIAAARRAAQAALQQAPAASQAPEPAIDDDFADDSDGRSLRAKMMKRMKSLFVAASIVAIVVGSVQIGGNMLGLGGAGSKTAQHVEPQPAAPETDVSDRHAAAAPSPPVSAPGFNLLTPPPATIPFTVPARPTTTVAAMPPPDPRDSVQSAQSLPDPQAASAPADITGSIAKQTRNARPATPPSGHSAERLPAAIGSQALRSAAAAGNAAASYEVAQRFAEGRGVPANMDEAARWYERAAAKGLAPAQFRYGSMLEKGQGVKKDLGQARRLYLAAAAQGNAKAMHNLAVLYAEGIEGRPDYPTAAQWFRKAGQHGVADSQYNLGVLYARGIGVAKDMGESYKWFALAAARGDRESARKRDELAGQLDAATLAAARHAVDSFKAAPQPELANTVSGPPGGWDKSGEAPASGSRHYGTGPLVIGKR